MKARNTAALSGLTGVAALCVTLAACGTGGGTDSTVSGVAWDGSPLAGTVTLRDSSAAPQARQAASGPDGAFALDVSGLTAPFLLRVATPGGARLYSIAEGPGRTDLNPITTFAYGEATGSADLEGDFERSGSREHHRGATRLRALLTQLRTVLAPLFQLYGVSDPRTDRAGVRAMLRDVGFSVRDGVLTVTNRATGGVIFTGPLSDLASGTFDASSLPAGPGTPPPSTGDGAALYQASCASCHGPLDASSVLGASAGDIREAIQEDEGGMGALSGLTRDQIASIAAALAGSPPPPPPPPAGACTYSYGAYGACDASGLQSRPVLSATPPGCTGTPDTTRACTPPPPPPTACTYTYSAFGACQANGTQVRTVLSATPPGCTGTPVLTQSCTPALDGAALYTQYCAGCHGNSKKGSSVTAINRAIANNTGGMGTAALRGLTAAQIAAISAAP